MYRYLFGPVPSRRLGVSLGVDLTPDKSCSFNCVYCECGKTGALTAARREYTPTAEVISELRAFLLKAPRLDSITFSGSGEPTLHTGLGTVVSFLKEEFPAYRVTVITNSSLLHLREVRDALLQADLVIPSLDAVSETVFRHVNRPVPGMTSTALIDGLRVFCDSFPGKIWLEIFLVPGLNDTTHEIELFRALLQTLRYERVQLNTLDRPGAVSWIAPVGTRRLEEIARSLGERVEIVASRRPGASMSEHDSEVRNLVLSTLQVRPCTISELTDVTGYSADDLLPLLHALIADDLLETRDESSGLVYHGRIGRHTFR
ncbi:MAG: radical SAM protein [Ignavibacteriae bacterium]|nr:radical SAM protein [Ignavibacteriota bacterium]